MKNLKSSCTLILLLIFTGCLNYEQITTIKKDGSGKMYFHFWTGYSNSSDTNFVVTSNLFNKDTLQKEIDKSFVDLNFIEKYVNLKDSTIHIQAEFTFTNIDSLSKIKLFKNSEIRIEQISSTNWLFSQKLPDIPDYIANKDSGYTFKYTYYLPGKVFSHNADNSTLNKITLFKNINEIKPNTTISANFKPFKLNETPPVIYYLTLTVLILVLIFLLRPKRD